MKLKLTIFIICITFFDFLIASAPLTLSGTIVNSKTGKTVEGVNILVKEKVTGTISNEKGSYLLHLPKGEYNLIISGKDFKKKTQLISLKEDAIKKILIDPIQTTSSKRKRNDQNRAL